MQEALIPRYGRQMLLHGVGSPGQSRLLRAQAVIVGAGGASIVLSPLSTALPLPPYRPLHRALSSHSQA